MFCFSRLTPQTHLLTFHNTQRNCPLIVYLKCATRPQQYSRLLWIGLDCCPVFARIMAQKIYKLPSTCCDTNGYIETVLSLGVQHEGLQTGHNFPQVNCTQPPVIKFTCTWFCWECQYYIWAFSWSPDAETKVNVTPETYALLQAQIDPLGESDNFGIELYESTVWSLQTWYVCYWSSPFHNVKSYTVLHDN